MLVGTGEGTVVLVAVGTALTLVVEVAPLDPPATGVPFKLGAPVRGAAVEVGSPSEQAIKTKSKRANPTMTCNFMIKLLIERFNSLFLFKESTHLEPETRQYIFAIQLAFQVKQSRIRIIQAIYCYEFLK